MWVQNLTVLQSLLEENRIVGIGVAQGVINMDNPSSLNEHVMAYLDHEIHVNADLKSQRRSGCETYFINVKRRQI